MFSLEQKRLADAQASLLVALIRRHPGLPYKQAAALSGLRVAEVEALLESFEPGEEKIARLEELATLVASEPIGAERIAQDRALLDGVDDDFANAIGEDYMDWSPDPEYPTTTWGWIRWYGPVRWLRVRYRMWLFWRLWHRRG